MRRVAGRQVVLAGLVIAVLVAVVASPLASSRPDGLTRVSQDHGFARADGGKGSPGSLAAGASAVGVFVLAAGVGVVLRRRSRGAA